MVSWIVNWQVVSGAFGDRPNDGRSQVWVGETIRFTLSPDPGLPNSYGMREDAQHSRNWAQVPQLVATGYQSGGTPVSIPVRHNPSNPLQFDYQFRFEGRKQLRFTGTPLEVVLPTAIRSARPSRTVLFPPVQYEMDLQVAPRPGTGRDAASMAGATGRSYERGEREREQEQERYRRVEREGERERRRDRTTRETEQAATRETALADADTPRERRSIRNGLLNFRMRGEPEILGMSITQVEDYLLNLQAAIAVTPPLNLVNRGWRSQGSELQYADVWVTERLQDGRIKFYQERRFRSARPAATARGLEIRSVPESYSHNEIIFPGNGWVVAQVTGRSEIALLPVVEMANQLEAEQWERLFGGLVSLASFVIEAAVAPEAAVVGLLLEMILPPEVMLAVAAASIVRGLASGLRAVITRGFQRSARSAAAGRAITAVVGTADDAAITGRATRSRSVTARGVDSGGRGIPPGHESGGGVPPRRGSPGEGLGRRRPRYRGSARPVIGRIDAITRRGLVQDASPGELMTAEAFGRAGHEVVVLPETEMGWRQLVFQSGWSRSEVESLRRQLAEAMRRDGLSLSRNPDLLVNGRVWDVLAPSTLQGGRTLSEEALTSIIQGIWAKGESLQTRRVAYVVDGFSESLSEIRAALRRQIGGGASPFGGRIEEVALVQRGMLIEIYSRGRGVSL